MLSLAIRNKQPEDIILSIDGHDIAILRHLKKMRGDFAQHYIAIDAKKIINVRREPRNERRTL